MSTRVKFATQVDGDLLAAARKLARKEGRQIQALIEEALTDLLEKRQSARPRAHVIAHLEASLAQFDTLYGKLHG